MKERLVGAAVLVAIAVWLIPWVLDGPEGGVEGASGTSLELPAAEEPVPIRTQTLRLGDPPEPSAPPPAAAAQAVQPTATAQAARTEPEPSREPERAAEPPAAATESAVAAARAESERPTTAAAPTPKPPAAGDWAVQLGSFGEEANARRLAQRAGTFGYKAEVSTYSDRGRTLYRVRVGPQRTRAEADAVASALRVHGITDARVVEAR